MRNGGVKALLVIPGREMEGLKQKLSIIILFVVRGIQYCSAVKFSGGQYLFLKLGGGGINSRELGIHFYHGIPLLTAPFRP